MASTIDTIDYIARQSARVAWYMGHGFAARRYRAGDDPDDIRRQKPREPGPGTDRLMREMAALWRRDLANVQAGIYPNPRDHDGSLLQRLARSRKFFADIPSAVERKQERRGTEIYDHELTEKYPAYFLQNFHYQTGGYLTEGSAEIYDTQVEVLFSGTTNAMRRQCLVPLASFMKGKDQRTIAIADIACGTGRFMRFVKQSYPRIKGSGVDLSSTYLQEARGHLKPYDDVDFLQAKAEELPFEDNSLDVLTSIYLFHEVPGKIRREIAREWARVLKPGGRMIFMDSLQLGDIDGFDGMLQSFPINFHEPYYANYIKDDLEAVFGDAGFDVVSQEPVFLSKMLVADKPG